MRRRLHLHALATALLLGLLVAACEDTKPTPSTITATPEPKPRASTATTATTARTPTSHQSNATSQPGASAGLEHHPHATAHPMPAKPPDIPAPADVAEPPKDAKKTPSGLASKVLTPGKGKAHPKAEDIVKVHYTGWTKEGQMFDSSVASGGEPVSFPLNQVIKGWTEGLQLMVAGEKRRLWLPGALAYGETPQMGAPAGDLVFDVELLEITEAPKPPPVPADVKAAPKDAKKTPSGLAYKLLKKGTGTKQPKATDTVSVHYTGWTPDGNMFDSSIVRGEPTSFPLDKVIKGWTEGVQLMKVGETMRFWIPSELAYGDKPKRAGAPAGMLVFDVELLSIQQ